MRVAEQAGCRVSERLVCQMALAIGGFADREIAAFALIAFAANDREGHDDAVALLQLAVDAGADLDHFAHGLVAHDVAGQHARNVVVKEVQVGAADGAACDLNDRVARILNLRIGDGVAANVFLAVPNQRLHLCSPASYEASKSNNERWLLSRGAKSLRRSGVRPDRNERPPRRLERHQSHLKDKRRIRSWPPINSPSSPAPPPASAWNSPDVAPKEGSTLSSRRMSPRSRGLLSISAGSVPASRRSKPISPPRKASTSSAPPSATGRSTRCWPMPASASARPSSTRILPGSSTSSTPTSPVRCI